LAAGPSPGIGTLGDRCAVGPARPRLAIGESDYPVATRKWDTLYGIKNTPLGKVAPRSSYPAVLNGLADTLRCQVNADLLALITRLNRRGRFAFRRFHSLLLGL